MTTYVFGPSNPDHVHHYCEEGSEIVPNVIYMGKNSFETFENMHRVTLLFLLITINK